jgi:single-strand DNA-binding protein
MSFQITGILKVKGAEQVVSDKFKKREFVLTDNQSQYPQHVSFQLAQDKCSLIDGFDVGQEIKVSFNLRGREWNDPKSGQVKYFNSLDAWRIESNMAAASPAGAAPSSNTAQVSNATPVFTASAADDDDDLPF